MQLPSSGDIVIKISKNKGHSSSRGVDIFQQAQSCLGPFPMPLSVVRPVSLQINAICWGDLPKRLSLSEISSPAYTRTPLA